MKFDDFFLSSRHLKRREEEETMKAFEEAMKHDTTDEEAKRKFYLSKIRWWVNTAFDDLGYLHGKRHSFLLLIKIRSIHLQMNFEFYFNANHSMAKNLHVVCLQMQQQPVDLSSRLFSLGINYKHERSVEVIRAYQQ